MAPSPQSVVCTLRVILTRVSAAFVNTMGWHSWAYVTTLKGRKDSEDVIKVPVDLEFIKGKMT